MRFCGNLSEVLVNNIIQLTEIPDKLVNAQHKRHAGQFHLPVRGSEDRHLVRDHRNVLIISLGLQFVYIHSECFNVVQISG